MSNIPGKDDFEEKVQKKARKLLAYDHKKWAKKFRKRWEKLFGDFFFYQHVLNSISRPYPGEGQVEIEDEYRYLEGLFAQMLVAEYFYFLANNLPLRSRHQLVKSFLADIEKNISYPDLHIIERVEDLIEKFT